MTERILIVRALDPTGGKPSQKRNSAEEDPSQKSEREEPKLDPKKVKGEWQTRIKGGNHSMGQM